MPQMPDDQPRQTGGHKMDEVTINQAQADSLICHIMDIEMNAITQPDSSNPKHAAAQANKQILILKQMASTARQMAEHLFRGRNQ